MKKRNFSPGTSLCVALLVLLSSFLSTACDAHPHQPKAENQTPAAGERLEESEQKETGIAEEISPPQLDEIQVWPLRQEKDDFFLIVEDQAPDFHDFQAVNLEEHFVPEKEQAYPAGVAFIPEMLDKDGLLWGEADASGTRTALKLASYDLTNQHFVSYDLGESLSEQAGLGVKYIDEDYVIYEVHDYIRQSVYLDILQRESGEQRNILTMEQAPSIHISQVGAMKESFLISTFDPASGGYTVSSYDPRSRKRTAIENKNSGFPVYAHGKLYYLLVDNSKLRTQLVELDFERQEKIVRLETNGKKQYLNGLYGTDQGVMLVMNQDGRYHWLLLDPADGFLHCLFTSGAAEAVDTAQGYYTWSGPSEQEERDRLEYFFVHPEDKMRYVNPSGRILCSESGFAVIHYRKPDREIPKGAMYTDDNSSIRFYRYPLAEKCLGDSSLPGDE